ncbi:MAG: heme biosynthesis HemY N-terminal domain-containing protein [Gammaproteobacteria bacterium]
MKYAFYILLALILAVIVAALVHSGTGYVLLSWRDTSVEMAFTTLAVLILIVFFGLYVLTTLVVKLWAFPRRMRTALERRRELRARRSAIRGLIDLAEGRWAESEHNLVRHARDSKVPLVTYIAAARAAQMQGAHERRDAYLRRAAEREPAAQLAVLVTQAELQIAHKQYEHALATLRHLRELDTRHAHGLHLLARVYVKLGDWKALKELVPELRDQHAMPRRRIDRLECRALAMLLERVEPAGGLAEIHALWNGLPRRLRVDPVAAGAYARALLRCDDSKAAEAVLREALKSHWDDELVRLYGEALSDDRVRQLARVETWLGDKGESAALLLTAGRLCVAARLWGKARSYLESSIALAASAEAYQELGKLMLTLGEPEHARQAFNDGLALSLGERIQAYKPGEPHLRRVRGGSYPA